jgi:putative peptidoglycan lipid II flippase
MDLTTASAEQDTPRPRGGGFGAAAVLMTLAIFASRVLGLVRDMVVARQFGATEIVDSFYAAMFIPDLLFFLISGGALSTTLIPVLTGYLSKGEDEEAWRVFSIATTAACVLVGSLVVLGEIFAGPLMGSVFRDLSPSALRMAQENSRIVLPQALLMVLGGVLMGALYSRKRFWEPAISPLVYNAFIILGAVLLGPTMGARGLAWGVLVGAIVGPVLIPSLALRRMGARFSPSLHLRHPGVQKVALLMLPVIFGLALPQLLGILTRFFAQGLGEGAIALLNYAFRIMVAPVAIFGQALGVAVYPTLSQNAAERKMDEFRRNLSLGFRSITFITAPVTVLMIVLSVPIVQILYEHGVWAPSKTPACAQLVAFYSIGIIAQSSSGIITRGFYAIQDTVTPVAAGLVSLAAFAAGALVFISPLGMNGLALAVGAASVINIACLLVLLTRKVGWSDGTRTLVGTLKILAASLAMVAPAYYGREWLHARLGAGFFGALGEFVIVSAGCTAVYLLVVSVLRAEELAVVRDALARRRRL